MTIIKEKSNLNVNLNTVFSLLENKGMISIQDICDCTIDHLMQERIATPSQIQSLPTNAKKNRSYQCERGESIKKYDLFTKTHLISKEQKKK